MICLDLEIEEFFVTLCWYKRQAHIEGFVQDEDLHCISSGDYIILQ